MTRSMTTTFCVNHGWFKIQNIFSTKPRPTSSRAMGEIITQMYGSIECFHMTSRRPYWCPKTMKRRSCWCPKPVLWELNSFLMQTLSFVPNNLHRCWPLEWKHSIFTFFGEERNVFVLQESNRGGGEGWGISRSPAYC